MHCVGVDGPEDQSYDGYIKSKQAAADVNGQGLSLERWRSCRPYDLVLVRLNCYHLSLPQVLDWVHRMARYDTTAFPSRHFAVHVLTFPALYPVCLLAAMIFFCPLLLPSLRISLLIHWQTLILVVNSRVSR
jgi:hypothetical protein